MPKNRTIFISHNRADKPFARRLRSALVRSGLDVWLDENEIAAGMSITEQVSTALERSAAFLLVLSPAAMRAPWVKREIWSSLHRSLSQRDCDIIPILRKPCDIPSIIRDLQYIDFTRDFGLGVTLLNERLRELKLHTTPGGTRPTKAKEQLVFLRWEVDIDILNRRGDAYYQVNVTILNNLHKRLTIGPMHSFWTAGAPASLKQIAAFDAKGGLKADRASVIHQGTALSFCLKPRTPIAPGRVWNYRWEVLGRRAWQTMSTGDSYSYRGESPVRELLVKIRLPKGMTGSGRAVCRWDKSGTAPVPWTQLHGRAALVYRRDDVAAGENMSLTFKAK